MKKLLKKLFGMSETTDKNEQIDAVQDKSVDNDVHGEETSMEDWQDRTNELITAAATALFHMLGSDDWDVSYLVGVPLEESVEARFYYVTMDGKAYSGQNLANPGVITEGYIERTMDMAQAIRELYLHFKGANMQTPSTIMVKVTSEGSVDMNFNYDEDISDTDAFFDDFETTQFNNLNR